MNLTLVDNSDDGVTHSKVDAWLEDFRASVPDWTLQLLRSPGNVGYGRGNNRVIANARADYHIVINPDLFVDADALLQALHFMEDHRDVGLLTPSVFGEEGERHYLCKRYPTLFIMFLRSFAPLWLRAKLSAVVNEFEMRDCNYDKVISPVEYPTGCFMFFRMTPLQVIGGFDPDFFLHYEDADIGRRMLKVARVVYVPAVRVVHQWARGTHRSMHSRLITVRSGWLYWRKWGGMFKSKPAGESPMGTLPTSEMSSPESIAAPGLRVLVTGANGFVGQAACADLLARGHRVLGVVRKSSETSRPFATQLHAMGDIDENTDWSEVIFEVDSVVHLAARVHLMRETATNPLAEFRRINVALTINLARQAAAAGVKRFVFISSVKVNGESTPVGQPFEADDVPLPFDAYGVSKWEAEQALMQLARESDMEIVIIRPVLVYGPGVKANFHAMMRWVVRGVPLPLGLLGNQRSLIAIDNLVDLIATCLHHPAAANQTFLVSDGEDLTVTALLHRTAAAFGRPARLLPVPMFILKVGGRMLGKGAVVQRLCEALQVDITKTRRLLGWQPPVSVDGALRKTVRQLLKE
jgi:nucleoside-diphosphate-sugar epimerase/GT2 family glycosyltransferase